jgi:hypothetical protein
MVSLRMGTPSAFSGGAVSDVVVCCSVNACSPSARRVPIPARVKLSAPPFEAELPRSRKQRERSPTATASQVRGHDEVWMWPSRPPCGRACERRVDDRSTRCGARRALAPAFHVRPRDRTPDHTPSQQALPILGIPRARTSAAVAMPAVSGSRRPRCCPSRQAKFARTSGPPCCSSTEQRSLVSPTTRTAHAGEATQILALSEAAYWELQAASREDVFGGFAGILVELADSNRRPPLDVPARGLVEQRQGEL